MCGYDIFDDKLKEECGVFGIYDPEGSGIGEMSYIALVSLQHRGQESAGISVSNNGNITCSKGMGLVRDVFDSESVGDFEGQLGVSHVRYSTTGDTNIMNAQPLVVKYKGGSLSLAHNGNLVNAGAIRNLLEDSGVIFQTTIDTEVIAALIAKNFKNGLSEALTETFQAIKGSFSIVMVCEDMLVGARDSHGLRPLSIGRLSSGGYVMASETCALDSIGAEYVRDVEPGEIVLVNRDGLQSLKYAKGVRKAMCSFEYVYFARADSMLNGKSVYRTRRDSGMILGEEHPVEADVVIGVPDSGLPGAIGFSEKCKIPFEIALIKNRYLGRTFIQPTQDMRESGVRMKLNVVRELVEGKRVVLIDDSIVRGTTIKHIIGMIRDAGAKEIHVRITSPPVTHSCYFGIDTPSEKHLIGSTMRTAEICEMIGADSLGHLSTDGLVRAIGLSRSSLCTACFSGEYPMAVPKDSCKFLFEKQ
jgi:amidophosphoribosyltransferase